MSYINLCDKCKYYDNCSVGRHAGISKKAYRIANMPFFGPRQNDHPSVVEIVTECPKYEYDSNI